MAVSSDLPMPCLSQLANACTATHKPSTMSKHQPTILFLTNSELGQASVMLAVAAELASPTTSHDPPPLSLHLASFPALASSTPAGVTFHPLGDWPSMKDALAARGLDFMPRHKPAHRDAYAVAYPAALAPWTPAAYLGLVRHCKELMEKLGPDLVVVDPLFGPGVDACRVEGQKHLILSPSTFKDHVMKAQGLAVLWKFAIFASGLSTPVPIFLILYNVFLLLRAKVLINKSAPVSALIKARHDAGLKGFPPSAFVDFQTNVPYLVPSLPPTDYPLVIPANMHGCGPILPNFKPLKETNPELDAWLAQGDTIVVNMGSHAAHAADQTKEMLAALTDLLARNPSVQVLWKCPSPLPPTSIPTHLGSRLQILPWLPATPAAILTSHPDKMLAFVHHGGSNSFHEALAAGVPQVVCPVWLDTYDFAVRAEFLGVGVWGSRKAAPAVERNELAATLETVCVVGRGGEGVAEGLRAQARRLAGVVGGVHVGRRRAAAWVRGCAMGELSGL